MLIGSTAALSLFIIGGLLIYFNFSNPGEARAAVSGDYRSVQSGAWNTTSTWETFNGVVWTPTAVAPSTSSNVVEICSGHTVTVSFNKSVDQVIIDNGGTLSVNS